MEIAGACFDAVGVRGRGETYSSYHRKYDRGWVCRIRDEGDMEDRSSVYD